MRAHPAQGILQRLNVTLNSADSSRRAQVWRLNHRLQFLEKKRKCLIVHGQFAVRYQPSPGGSIIVAPFLTLSEYFHWAALVHLQIPAVVLWLGSWVVVSCRHQNTTTMRGTATSIGTTMQTPPHVVKLENGCQPFLEVGNLVEAAEVSMVAHPSPRGALPPTFADRRLSIWGTATNIDLSHKLIIGPR